jgi:hypothetical protein
MERRGGASAIPLQGKGKGKALIRTNITLAAPHSTLQAGATFPRTEDVQSAAGRSLHPDDNGLNEIVRRITKLYKMIAENLDKDISEL